MLMGSIYYEVILAAGYRPHDGAKRCSGMYGEWESSGTGIQNSNPQNSAAAKI